jgi:hypothetical protein
MPVIFVAAAQHDDVTRLGLGILTEGLPCSRLFCLIAKLCRGDIVSQGVILAKSILSDRAQELRTPVIALMPSGSALKLFNHSTAILTALFMDAKVMPRLRQKKFAR